MNNDERVIKSVDSFIVGVERVIKSVDSFIVGVERVIKSVDSFIVGVERVIKSVDSSIVGVEWVIKSVDSAIIGVDRGIKSVDSAIVGVEWVIKSDDPSIVGVDRGVIPLPIGNEIFPESKFSLTAMGIAPTSATINECRGNAPVLAPEQTAGSSKPTYQGGHHTRPAQTIAITLFPFFFTPLKNTSVFFHT